MQEKQIQQFLGQYVTLVQTNNFVLTGLIENVYKDSVLFATPEERALIRMENIKSLRMKLKGGGKGNR